jgi:hypothetical protein
MDGGGVGGNEHVEFTEAVGHLASVEALIVYIFAISRS